MKEFEIEELPGLEIRLTHIGAENIYFEYKDQGELVEGFCKCSDQWLRLGDPQADVSRVYLICAECGEPIEKFKQDHQADTGHTFIDVWKCPCGG